MEKVAVYGTLKKWWLWHNLLQQAKPKYIWLRDIEILSIRNIKSDYKGNIDRYYPHIIFKKGTWKFLSTELYEISLEMIKKYLDPLEEYTWFESDPYTRKIVKTALWENVWVYDSNWEAWNDTDIFFTHQNSQGLFYNWTENNIWK